MSDRLGQLLKSLRDVEGVVGSFVWGKSGAVLARDLPEFLDAGVLDEVGPRIERIYEAFQGAGDELDCATLVFNEHKLHLRELDPGYIAVVSLPRVNAPALKMALHLVGRNLCLELERMKSSPPPAPAATQASRSPSSKAPPALPVGSAAAPKAASTLPPQGAATAVAAKAEPPPRQSRTRFWRGSRIPD